MASIYFCNLEKNNYTDKKSIKRLKIENGTNIYDHKSILIEIKKFYEKLFAQQKCLNKEVDLRIYMKNYNLPQLNERDVVKLEGKLTLTEISKALKVIGSILRTIVRHR